MSPDDSKKDHSYIANDLPVALYLDPRLVYDLLATLEGGFAQFSTVQTTTSSSTESEIDGGIQGNFGFGAIVRVELGANANRQQGQAMGENIAFQLMQTPVSLFARLLRTLKEDELVKSPDNLENIRPGDFVEFEATLQRNPLIGVLASLSDLGTMVTEFSGGSAQGTKNGQQRNRKKINTKRGADPQGEEVQKIIRTLEQVLTPGTSEDLVASMREEMKAVLTVNHSSFSDPSMNDIIDGTFRVFGKATRVIHKNDAETERISLLRKSTLGQLKPFKDLWDTLPELQQQIGLEGSIETEIGGPALQVIPIAIYV